MLKRWLYILLKCLGIVLAALLVIHTLKSTDADILNSVCHASKPLLAISLLMYGLIQLMGAWRLQFLLNVQKISISLMTLFNLTLIGIFFSTIIPGSISGDLIKLACLTSHAGKKKTEAVLTIVMDRFLGMLGLFFVAIVSLALLAVLYPDIILVHKTILIAASAILAMTIAMILTMSIIALRRYILRIAIISRIFNWLKSITPHKIAALLIRIAEALDLYKNQPGALLNVLGISIAIHSMQAVINLLIGKAFHEHAMNFLNYMVTTQVGNASGVVPLTPGGIGIRDSITAIFLECFNASPAEAVALIPVTFSMIIVCWAIVGAIIMLFWHGIPKTNYADLQE